MLSALGFQEQSDAEKQLSALLYDENEQVLSSLQLNQLASYTYHERSMTGGRLIFERMLDILEQVISRPLDVSVLAMHKALVVLRHLLLYGAEQVLGPAQTLRHYVATIEEKYNTAVMAQEATGATGFFIRLKGGSVDKGGPARQVAQSIHRLLSDPAVLQFERNTHADPQSLVPIGSRQQVAFVTDEARLAILQRRMEQERQVTLKSNLAKSDSAFGSGYNSKDGKAVVGAAHSLEEMIKDAQKKEQAAKQRFTDEPSSSNNAGGSNFSEYQAPNAFGAITPAPPPQVDLLSMGATTTAYPGMRSSSSSNNNNNDLLSLGMSHPGPTGGSSMMGNLLDLQSSAPKTQNQTPAPDLLQVPSGNIMNPITTAPLAGGMNPSMNAVGTGLTTLTGTSVTTAVMSFSSGNHSVDRFAALDALNPLVGSHNGLQQHKPSNTQSQSWQMGGGGGASFPQNNNKAGSINGLDSLNPLDGSRSGLQQHKPSHTQSWQQGGGGPSFPHNSNNVGNMNGLDSLDRLSISSPSTSSLTPMAPPPAGSAPTLGATSFAVTGAPARPPPEPLKTPIALSQRQSSDDSTGGFVMGGPPGSGVLEPVGAAPAAPPPPPPAPTSFYY